MLSSLQKTYALSDKGLADVKKGTLWTMVTNLVSMCGVGALFFAMMSFMDVLVDHAVLPDVAPVFVGLAVFLVLLFFSNWQQYYYTYCVFYEECGNQRIALAERLRKLPLSFFGRRDIADLTETVMGDVQTMEHAYSHVLGELLGAACSTLVVFVACLVFDWRLACAAFWSVPFAFALLFLTRKMLEPMVRRTRNASVHVSEGVQEMLDCIREIRATNQEIRYQESLESRIDSSEKSMCKGELTNGLIVNSAMAILRLSIATTLVCGAYLVGSAQIDFMVMFAFLLVVSRIYAPFDQALTLISELFMSRNSARRMQEIMEEPVSEGNCTFKPANHDVVFSHVSFSYDSGSDSNNSSNNGDCFGGDKGSDADTRKPVCSDKARRNNVLDDVSFVAKEGEVTALVGPSGSGKSTCARLAARFWDATSGSVSVGGIDVSTVDPETLLRDYAIVFQDVLLFDDTVMENIRLGRRDATDEEVYAAAKAANCDEFVMRMKDGYSASIGENGSKLSGGERQRISIARALLKDAPIVLLDEATASLDVENETEVQQALSRLLAGKTVIVIAHRMRTVENADHVVVLSEGRVVEQGSAAELHAKGGMFARMVELQKESACWSL